MDHHLGEQSARVWADQIVLADLDNRTVREALDDAVDFKTVWRAVWRFLELPDNQR
jgi:hypothetical protein